MTSRIPWFYHISRSSAAVDIEQRAKGKSPSRIDVRAPKAEKTYKRYEGFNLTKKLWNLKYNYKAGLVKVSDMYTLVDS